MYYIPIAASFVRRNGSLDVASNHTTKFFIRLVLTHMFLLLFVFTMISSAQTMNLAGSGLSAGFLNLLHQNNAHYCVI